MIEGNYFYEEPVYESILNCRSSINFYLQYRFVIIAISFILIETQNHFKLIDWFAYFLLNYSSNDYLKSRSYVCGFVGITVVFGSGSFLGCKKCKIVIKNYKVYFIYLSKVIW